MTKIKFRLVSPGARPPARQHPHDAGWDVYSVNHALIVAGERHTVSTGLSFDIPPGWEIQVRPRSGLARDFGVTVLNAPSTIDAGYSGVVAVVLINHGRAAFKVMPGDRIAQLVPVKLPSVDFELTTDPPPATARGAAGFGSTGRG